MTQPRSLRNRALTVTALAASSALLLAGCAGGGNAGGTNGGDAAGGNSGEPITIGTTDKIRSLDPAGQYDNGSFAVITQTYGSLLRSKPGESDVSPDLAESAEFSSPKVYTVKLREGLKFTNGHDLTASDVKFSFDRVVAINDPNGPASLLYNLESVEVVDDLTVNFNLKAENDVIFPQILSSPAGPIVDEEVFKADTIATDEEIVAADAFAGPYRIDSYEKNSLVSYTKNPDYQGVIDGGAKTDNIIVKYYSDASNLKLEIENGTIDVAWRSLSATDIAALGNVDGLTVHNGPGGEIRYLVFNFNTQPFGASTPEADPAKAEAVRHAIAHLINREELSQQVYQGTYTPLYSHVPDGLTGATEELKTLYGDGNGGASVDKAKETLTAAGITDPVTLNIQYSNDHYGPSSADEYALIKDQLEASGLFTVNLQTTEWGQYSKDRVADLYPVYQLGWFPDYSDADNYLAPFFMTENFISNHYSNPQMDELLLKQAVTTDEAERENLIGEIQKVAANDLSTLPYLQGSQIAISKSDIGGVDDTLDASFTFRYALLERN